VGKWGKADKQLKLYPIYRFFPSGYACSCLSPADLGKAVFRSLGQTFSTDFSPGQLRDGTIAGAVRLLGITEGVSLTMLVSDLGVFDLEALDKEQSFAISVQGCHFTHMVSGANALQGEFIASRET
jgi:hypothetical protein